MKPVAQAPRLHAFGSPPGPAAPRSRGSHVQGAPCAPRCTDRPCAASPAPGPAFWPPSRGPALPRSPADSRGQRGNVWKQAPKSGPLLCRSLALSKTPSCPNIYVRMRVRSTILNLSLHTAWFVISQTSVPHREWRQRSAFLSNLPTPCRISIPLPLPELILSDSKCI